MTLYPFSTARDLVTSLQLATTIQAADCRFYNTAFVPIKIAHLFDEHAYIDSVS
jgi:hypothetical protein